MPVSYNFPLRLDDDLREKLRYIAEKNSRWHRRPTAMEGPEGPGFRGDLPRSPGRRRPGAIRPRLWAFCPSARR